MNTYYTKENIMSDIDDPKVDNIIGCRVYFGETPEEVLEHANAHDYDYWGTFLGVQDGRFDVREDNSGWECIIPCQSQEFEGDYIPFDSKYEFIDRYYEIMKSFKNIEDELPSEIKLMECGMFIQEKYSPAIYQVLEINNFSISISRHDSLVTWYDLLKHFEFLDGSKCGKLYQKDATA